MTEAARWYSLCPLLGLLCGMCGVLAAAEQLALLEVLVEQRPGISTLQGQLLHPRKGSEQQGREAEGLEGALVLVHHDELIQEAPESTGSRVAPENSQDTELWIGVVPVDLDQKVSTGNQESFADAVVQKMKRALVLGASALIILALNQNTVSEMDLSQVLVKPIIVIQSSENVTRLFGALLRGLQATVKITYQTILQDDLGATLTLWSSCGRSRDSRYGEWLGVICTGESNSQKYLQQLWDTVLLVVLILSTGVLLQAHLQAQEQPRDNQRQLFTKQDVVRRVSSLQTKTYSEAVESGPCAVCLEPFYSSQCLRVLPCGHEYHQDCVDPWLLLRHTCPLCKRCILGQTSSVHHCFSCSVWSSAVTTCSSSGSIFSINFTHRLFLFYFFVFQYIVKASQLRAN
ncbi:RING finger protein 215 isoform X2 [Boleophthalmus pectinirostris]|uniref:RING finger protein 215 isoform X2 n=1 Tax=Boleophthalmus pectinirostris TaxID=150288 RepID=UPI0024304BBB|nr:RING finger protein 215 isoform X2 [Boleophthalmus pectinirostris]